MEFINMLPPEIQNDMHDLWDNCPAEVCNSMAIVDVPKGHSFIVAGQACTNIYILLKGVACGIDVQFSGKEYRFKKFMPGRILGEFECLSGISEYAISVQTVTPCTLCTVPSKQYVLWMKNDAHALFLRTQELLRILTTQTQKDRRFFLSPCHERMIQAFAEWYGDADQKEFYLRKTRNELANAMGFVVRTVDRNINKLVEEGFISLQGGRITISYEQYQKMKRHLKQNFAY